MDQLPERIVIYPDPRLRQRCREVTGFGDGLEALGGRMLELMRTHKGVGLAGPQVGVNLRLFVCSPTGEPADDRIIINPRLEDLSGAEEAEEGCLSIPEVRVIMRRARQCRLVGQDVHGAPFTLEGEGLLARIWQHEFDHLEGRLIIDRMNPTDRIANKKQIARLEAEFKRKNKPRKRLLG